MHQLSTKQFEKIEELIHDEWEDACPDDEGAWDKAEKITCRIEQILTSTE